MLNKLLIKYVLNKLVIFYLYQVAYILAYYFDAIHLKAQKKVSQVTPGHSMPSSIV